MGTALRTEPTTTSALVFHACKDQESLRRFIPRLLPLSCLAIFLFSKMYGIELNLLFNPYRNPPASTPKPPHRPAPPHPPPRLPTSTPSPHFQVAHLATPAPSTAAASFGSGGTTSGTSGHSQRLRQRWVTGGCRPAPCSRRNSGPARRRRRRLAGSTKRRRCSQLSSCVVGSRGARFRLVRPV